MLAWLRGARRSAMGGMEPTVGGAGGGPPIVFLHGNPDSHPVWSPVVARLSAKHRCIAPDLPGFGKTPLPASFRYSLEEQSAFVRGVFDAFELERAHLVIHDIGGVFGLAFATEH